MCPPTPPLQQGGLLELFYGVYNKDADRCLEALQAMGVYLPSGDRTAVRRTAEFFLKGFQVDSRGGGDGGGQRGRGAPHWERTRVTLCME